MTFGFDTAVSFATDAIDRLHTTAEAHRRIMVVEVMGRYAGWIALHSGVAGGADVILIPEIPFDLEKVAAHIREREPWGARFSIVVVAEGDHDDAEARAVVPHSRRCACSLCDTQYPESESRGRRDTRRAAQSSPRNAPSPQPP